MKKIQITRLQQLFSERREAILHWERAFLIVLMPLHIADSHFLAVGKLFSLGNSSATLRW